MCILTLTTDLGTRDYYSAVVKAAALSQISEVQIVDITHEVPPFNISEAAFMLRNVWRDFPEGTIHLIGVDTRWSKATPYAVVKKDGHYFIGTDNGIFSLLFDSEEGAEVYSLTMAGDEMPGFPTKTIFVPIAAAIAAGKTLSELGEQMAGYMVRPAVQPVVEYDNIRGSVIYVDGYGNVITNITRKLFEKHIGSRPFNIVLRRGDRDLGQISRTYDEVQEGEKVAIFSSGGHLEIAINRGTEGSGGGASSLLGLRRNDVVRIEFEG
ncbi:MAG: S-adenosyl-l-methionine hydroxide adenosyltransferase family protein [Cryomorphaceae bacterium]